jgi:hypothetical protein
MHGTIPCRAILANMYIITSSLCPVCSTHYEDTHHAFFTCPRAIEIWENLGIMVEIEESRTIDRAGSGVSEYILRQDDKKVPLIPELNMKELVAVACWYIWWERRKIVHEEKVQKPARSAQAIAVLSLNYYRALKKNSGIRRHGWEKPKEGYVKLNVDAAFSRDFSLAHRGRSLEILAADSLREAAVKFITLGMRQWRRQWLSVMAFF